MKRIILGCLFVSALSFEAHAHPPTEVACAGVRAVKLHVDELLTRYSPNEIAVISDNDGVLTDQSNPGPRPAKPRGDMVKVLKEWHQKGIFVTVSSAWDLFNETLKKLRTLGLADTLGLESDDSDSDSENETVSATISNTDTTVFNSDHSRTQAEEAAAREAAEMSQPRLEDPLHSIEGQEMLTRMLTPLIMERDNGRQIDYIKQGRVISARQNPSPEIFYRAKYFALDYADRGDLLPFKAVVIIDDSLGNLDLCKKNMHRTKWYQSAEEIHLLSLPSIFGKINRDDLLDPGTRFSFSATPSSSSGLTFSPAAFLANPGVASVSALGNPLTISAPAMISTNSATNLLLSDDSAGTPPATSYMPFAGKKETRDLAQSRVFGEDDDNMTDDSTRAFPASLNSSSSSTDSLNKSQEILVQ